MSRMSKERMEKALEQLKTISKEDYAKVKGLANVCRPLRSVIHKTPDDYGMTGWKDLYFVSDDAHIDYELAKGIVEANWIPTPVEKEPPPK